MKTLILTTALIATLAVGYSLMTAGKRGKGWMVVASFAALAIWFAKMMLSVFVEVTRSTSPPDWDEEI